MRSIRLLALLVVLLPLSVQGQEASNGWKEVVVPEGGFAVTLPEEVTRDQRYMGDTKEGRMADRVRAVTNAVVFEVAYTPLSPAEAKQKREYISTVTLDQLKDWGDPLCQNKFAVNGHPAVETLFRGRQGVYFRLRQIVTNDRFYYVVVESKKRDASVEDVRSAEVERFLSSFKLTDKKTR